MEIYKLYNGEVDLHYDDAKHQYFVDGKIVPGVTGVMEIINKPALVGWAAKMCSEFLLRNLKPGQPLDEIEITTLANQMKRAHRVHADRAADIGSLAHLYIENVIKYRLGINLIPPVSPVNEEAKNCIAAFTAWVSANQVKWIASEAKIYSRTFFYAGTLDIDAEINGERCIVDIKTSNGIWPEYLLQTAAYQQAREEELGVQYDARWILRIPKDGGVIEAKRYSNFERDFSAFASALVLQRNMTIIKAEFKEAA